MRLHEVVENAKYIVMVMDLCDSGNFAEYLSSRLPDMRLPELEAREMFRQVIGVFGKIHALGYVHRDIMFENLFLKRHKKTL